MPADQTRVKKRIMEVLNISAPGAYDGAVNTRIKNRNSAAIDDVVTETGLIILRFLATHPNEYRSQFIVPVALTHLQLLPEHQGLPAYVEIQRYNGAPWRDGDRRDYRKVDSYRQNINNIYDDLAHDAAGAKYSGLYDIWEQRFHFTGFAARAGLAQALRTDVPTKVPAMFENTWIRLGIGEMDKAGQGNFTSALGEKSYAKGMSDLNEFLGGKRQFPEVSDPEPTSAVHA